MRHVLRASILIEVESEDGSIPNVVAAVERGSVLVGEIAKTLPEGVRFINSLDGKPEVYWESSN